MPSLEAFSKIKHYNDLPDPSTLLFGFPKCGPDEVASMAVGTWAHLARKAGWEVGVEWVMDTPAADGQVAGVVVGGLRYNVYAGRRRLVPLVYHTEEGEQVTLVLKDSVWAVPADSSLVEQDRLYETLHAEDILE